MKKIDWKAILPFPAPEYSPGFSLWQVSTLWRRQLEAALNPLHLTLPQFVLLANVGWLTQDDNDITQIELARHCKTDITMTSQVLRVLEKKGYIERTQHNGNQKSKHPRLTQCGTELIEIGLPLVLAVDEVFFGKLNQDAPKYLEIIRKLI